MNDGPAVTISTTIEMELTSLLHALGDPVRLEIVRELDRDGTRACGSFGHLGVSPSTLSHHFRVLRDAGLVETSHAGTRRLNSLRREAVDDSFPGLLDAVLASAPSLR